MKMKNKIAKDIESKRQHINSIRASKRRREPDFSRKFESRIEKKSFLIICEGKNTEPSYFKKFKLTTAKVEVIGEGDNTFSLVSRAIRRKEDFEQQGQSFDFVWCVFDVDPKPDNPNQLTNFTNALSLAKSKEIKVAYSNQAFEYWLILHFEDHAGGAMPRGDYHDKINYYLKPLGCFYDGEGTKEIDDDFFNQLLVVIDKRLDEKGEVIAEITRQDRAIQRAKRNLNWHIGNGTSPARAESSSTVFELVEELVKYL